MSSTVFYEVVISIMHINFHQSCHSMNCWWAMTHQTMKLQIGISSTDEFLLHSLHRVPPLLSPCLTPQGGRLQTEGGEEIRKRNNLFNIVYTDTHHWHYYDIWKWHYEKSAPSTYICTHTCTLPSQSIPSLLTEGPQHTCNYTRPLTVSCSAWNGEQIAPNLCVDLRSISE